MKVILKVTGVIGGVRTNVHIVVADSGHPPPAPIPPRGQLGLPWLSVLGRDITSKDIQNIRRLPVDELAKQGIYKKRGGTGIESWLCLDLRGRERVRSPK